MRCKNGSLILRQIERKLLDFGNCGHAPEYNRRRFAEQAWQLRSWFGSISRARLHRNIHLSLGCEFDGAGVAGIGMAKDAQSWVACQDAFETMLGIFTPIGDHDHAGVLRISDADP